jgi:hypothetical protein
LQVPELQKENEMLHTRVLELTAALDAHESPGEAVKRRRSTNIESELPISEVDLDNLCKREANNAFPQWKRWSLVQVLQLPVV